MVLNVKSHTKFGPFLASANISKNRINQPVDAKFILALTDGDFCIEIEKKLLSLPAKNGGMGIVIFWNIAENEYINSRAVTASLIKV